MEHIGTIPLADQTKINNGIFGTVLQNTLDLHHQEVTEEQNSFRY